jgi:hypothetical protein
MWFGGLFCLKVVEVGCLFELVLSFEVVEVMKKKRNRNLEGRLWGLNRGGVLREVYARLAGTMRVWCHQ